MASARAQLLNESKHALDAFLNSSSSFQIIRTIASRKSSSDPKTLFILDSSFNPPHRAHASLAASALASRRLDLYPKPHRILLIFSTQNATKQPAPAAFEHRLAMMIAFAEDLVEKLSQKNSPSTRSPQARLQEESNRLGSSASADEADEVAIDIGLSTKPYYNEKSAAIKQTSPTPYPSDPKHVHITGFDALMRIFTPKYYDADPPLSALDSFFETCGLRVTVRPDEASVEGVSIEKQLAWANDVLGKGDLAEAGAKKQWQDRIDIVEADEEQLGVSSTKIRKAVKDGDWKEVKRLCSPGVAEYIREMQPYPEEG